MAWSSSPLPMGHVNVASRTPPNKARAAAPARDVDELAGDTIPCSPTAFWRDRAGSTQPTQIICPFFTKPSEPSSPPSIVEVPASSPFQPRLEPSRLGSRLAPAGTVFQPPRPAASAAPKRPLVETINLISDDESDRAPSRGDIRPTAFKAKLATFAFNPAANERETRRKLRQVYDAYGDKYPSDFVRRALEACRNDVEDALVWLDSHSSKPKSPKLPVMPAAKPNNSRRLISKGVTRQPLRQSDKHVPQKDSREDEPTIIVSPLAPKAPKRRLVQGLRKRGVSSTQMGKPEFLSSEDPLAVGLVDNDEDAYQAEESPEPCQDEDTSVLKCINRSTLQELGAMTGLKENVLEPFVAGRPFASLAQARRVSTNAKPRSRKTARISFGDSIVECVREFIHAVSYIDNVVAQCEAKARTVKDVMDSWDLDSFGLKKRSGRASPERYMPPTPTSSGSCRYTRPPLSRQPRLMDGHCEMKPFQIFGLNWMSLLYQKQIGCILADEMGLGKTCQVISFICHLVEEHERQRGGVRRPWPNLIVVPPSTYNNWLIEFEKFAPGLSVMGYRGSQAERAEIAMVIEQEPAAYHVVLATYSQINSEQDVDAMKSLALNAAVFDEGHKMKNPETKIYGDLKRIPASWKLLLTGTPVQNNLLEMTSLLNFINPRMFEGCMQHIRHIFSQKVTIRDVSNGAFLYSERVKRARTILEPFILQRRKDQVLADMPRKICTVVRCGMSETQRAVYDEYEQTFRLEPSQRVGWGGGRQNDQKNVWMQLRKAALHPLLFRRHFSDDKVLAMGELLMQNVPQSELHQTELRYLIQELKKSSDFELHLWCRDYPQYLAKFDVPESARLDSGKTKKLLELIEQYRRNGDRVLVFSKFSRLIELLQEVLALQGIDHRVLMGNTNVSERQTLIDEFNNDENIPVFLLTTGAGGTGINLTAANKVIIFDQSDNPQDDIQAENRAHRLGQKRDVEVVRLISVHTIEELVYKACQKKIELANKVTGAAESGTDQQKLEAEVRKLLEQEMTPP